MAGGARAGVAPGELPAVELDAYARAALDAASRAGLGVVVARLAPPRIVYVNEVAAAIFGASVAEIHSLTPLDLVAPSQRSLVEDRLRRRLAGEDLPPVELTIVRSDGRTATVECLIGDVRVDGAPGAAIFVSDVTGRRATDLAADARYRDLVDAAPDGVAISRDGRFLYANQVALRMFGCTTFADLSPRSLADCIRPEDVVAGQARAAAMMAGGRVPARDYRLTGRGIDTIAEARSVVIDFEGGPALLTFLRDVTETRRAQAELERTERLAALGTLVAGVAHEVNNPLSFATLGTELLRRFFDDGCRDPESGRAALSSVALGLDRVAALVRELRTFARADEQPLQPVDLSAAIDAALRMTAPDIRLRARLEIERGELPIVRGHAGRLEQVLVNLLVNAAQSFATPDVSRHVVRFSAATVDGAACITLEDNGAGIRPEHLPHVFDPFFTTKPIGVGTGLGLSICHAIVAQHGGRLSVSSTLGKGTTVTLVLPGRPAGELPAAPPPVVAPTVPRVRLLVVDDELAVLRALRDLLAPAHDVTIAASGAEAEALLASPEHEFDVVLCDLQMGDVPGATVFDRARARRPELARRFVFMTGGLLGPDLLARLGGPDAPRLEKPFSEADVATAVARVLAARASDR
jgi:PAS domain S-box-containing protein